MVTQYTKLGTSSVLKYTVALAHASGCSVAEFCFGDSLLIGAQSGSGTRRLSCSWIRHKNAAASVRAIRVINVSACLGLFSYYCPTCCTIAARCWNILCSAPCVSAPLWRRLKPATCSIGARRRPARKEQCAMARCHYCTVRGAHASAKGVGSLGLSDSPGAQRAEPTRSPVRANSLAGRDCTGRPSSADRLV